MIYLNPASVPLRILLSRLSATLSRIAPVTPLAATLTNHLRVLPCFGRNHLLVNPLSATFAETASVTLLSATLTKTQGWGYLCYKMLQPPLSRYSSSTLTSVRPQNRRDRFQQNPQVHPQAPGLDVFQIQRHVCLERRVAPRCYLPQPGHPRFDVQPPQVFDRV